MTDPVSFWPADFAGWAEALRNGGLILAGGAGFAIATWALNLNRRRTENDGKRLGNEALRLETERVRTVNDTYVKAIEQLGSTAMRYGLVRSMSWSGSRQRISTITGRSWKHSAPISGSGLPRNGGRMPRPKRAVPALLSLRVKQSKTQTVLRRIILRTVMPGSRSGSVQRRTFRPS
jgi:hypothetical protein